LNTNRMPTALASSIPLKIHQKSAPRESGALALWPAIYAGRTNGICGLVPHRGPPSAGLAKRAGTAKYRAAIEPKLAFRVRDALSSHFGERPSIGSTPGGRDATRAQDASR